MMASMLEMTLGDRHVWSTDEIEGGPLDPTTAESLGALRE